MEFEKDLKRLEEIVEAMSQGQLSLSDSLKLFKEGMALAQKCQKELRRVERAVEKLIAVHEDGAVQTEPLKPEK